MIAVTAGDPCGIGPEVILKALDRLPAPLHRRLLIIGDEAVFQRTARRLGRRPPRWREVQLSSSLSTASDCRLSIVDCRLSGGKIVNRKSSFENFQPAFLHVRPPGAAHAGRASLAYLEHALLLWRAGRIGALVTGPVTKWAIQRVRPGFVGQTEYLAQALGGCDVVMMFVSDRLRIALLTRHLPLRRVAGALTQDVLERSLRLTVQALRCSFRIARPKLALCGLNPHAGEAAPDSEERRVMQPILRALRRQGLVCEGPFAADGFFASDAVRAYDAIVCAYHDQGLIPFKMAARDRGCQFSAGLPLIRTSPDHGSALDIAGRGIAECGSMAYAIRLAARLSARR